MVQFLKRNTFYGNTIQESQFPETVETLTFPIGVWCAAKGNGEGKKTRKGRLEMPGYSDHPGGALYLVSIIVIFS